MLILSNRWRTAYPGASIGILVLSDVCNPAQSLPLDGKKQQLELALRAKFTKREEIAEYGHFPAYKDYYRRFGKTYHVFQQLESVALKDKAIPRAAGLVEAMFMAELHNGLLTAGHNWAALQLPLTVDISEGHEAYSSISGKALVTKAGDMLIHDTAGIISSIIFGPDARTRITADTAKALFVVYAPPGVDPDPVLDHLTEIEANVALFAPTAKLELKKVYSA